MIGRNFRGFLVEQCAIVIHLLRAGWKGLALPHTNFHSAISTTASTALPLPSHADLQVPQQLAPREADGIHAWVCRDGNCLSSFQTHSSSTHGRRASAERGLSSHTQDCAAEFPCGTSVGGFCRRIMRCANWWLGKPATVGTG